MSYMNNEEKIKEFYAFVAQEEGLENRLFSQENAKCFIDTAVDGYREYPLFTRLFDGNYDEKIMNRMISVDFRSRVGNIAGIATGGYEAVLLMEPPQTKKMGMLQYIKVANPSDYGLLFHRTTYQQEDYEKFAAEKRKACLNDTTWYLYVFATKKEFQGQGYGKKLMERVLSFADKAGYGICLETNLKKNVAMYEHFGFRLVDVSNYKGELEHYVMTYDSKKSSSFHRI